MNGTPAVFHAPTTRPRRSGTGAAHRRGCCSPLALVVALLGWGLPHLVGTTMHDVVTALKLVTEA